MITFRSRAALAAFVVGCLGAFAEVRAATLTWNNPSGGNAATASNWSPNQVPAAGDFLHHNLNATYTVTFSSAVPTSMQWRFRNKGNVTAVLNSPHTINGGLVMTDAIADTLDLKITTGMLTCNSPVSVGQFGKATLTVTTGDAILAVAGAAGNYLSVGTFGNGQLDVTNGGSVESQNGVVFGDFSFSVGRGVVTGRSITPLVHSNLTTTSATGDIQVGKGGYGQFDVENFGTVFCSGSVRIGSVAGLLFDGDGLVNVGQPTGTNVASLTVDRDLLLGVTGVGPPANSTLNIWKNGRVVVNGTTRFGSSTTTHGPTFHIERPGLFDLGGTLRTHDLELDENATFDFDSGVVTVDGGTLDTDGLPLTLNSTVASILLRPRFALTNGATAALPDTGFPAPSLTVGTTGVGEVAADSGGVWTLAADLVLGVSPGSFGMLKLTSEGRLEAPGQTARVGIDGTGQVDMTTGGDLTCASLEIGTDATGVGVVTANDLDTTILATNRIVIGANVLTADPVSSFILTGAAVADAGSASLAIHVDNSGLLAVRDFSQINALNGDVLVEGVLDLDEGFLVADSTHVAASGKLNGQGLVGGAVRNDGRIAPGASAGKLQLASRYVQGASGKLAIELGDHAASEWDTLEVFAAATLGGTLELTTLPTFDAPAGAIFTILTCGARTGTFATVTLNGAPLSPAEFTINYTATSVFLKAQSATDAPSILAVPSALALLGSRTPAGARLELALPTPAHTRLALYDVSGREVRVLRDAPTAAGRHRFDLETGGHRLASGVYFGRAIVEASGEVPATRTARVTIVR